MQGNFLSQAILDLYIKQSERFVEVRKKRFSNASIPIFI